jgi:hypothetical protein
MSWKDATGNIAEDARGAWMIRAVYREMNDRFASRPTAGSEVT